jgi:hypothetical protein
MDRADATGFGISAIGHVTLLALLSLALARAVSPPPPGQSIEVSFVDKIDIASASPEAAPSPPEAGAAPDLGPTADAAPAPAVVSAPPQPSPQPAPPQPAASERSADISPARDQARVRPDRTQPSATRRQSNAAPVANRQSAQGTGQRTTRSLLGPDLLRGIGRDPSPSHDNRAPGAVMSQQAAAGIGDAIKRQVQPCANQQVSPGPGANRIRTYINLRINRDGSLSARPRVVRQVGIDDENRRYADRVADLTIATFMGCAPLRGLPQELYDVPNGWSNFTLSYSLP